MGVRGTEKVKFGEPSQEVLFFTFFLSFFLSFSLSLFYYLFDYYYYDYYYLVVVI